MQWYKGRWQEHGGWSGGGRETGVMGKRMRTESHLHNHNLELGAFRQHVPIVDGGMLRGQKFGASFYRTLVGDRLTLNCATLELVH